jgi:hypothetical protein
MVSAPAVTSQADRLSEAVNIMRLSSFRGLAIAVAVWATAGADISGAGEADVIKADARREGGSRWSFDVTVRHADSGWDHYADKWDVVGPDGRVIATRTLLHPHENEQPFTRSLSGVVIPDAVSVVTIKAHDSVHGYGGDTVDVRLTR